MTLRFALCFLLLALSSCYRMPGEDDYSLVPMTNNPAMTNEKPSSLIPGMKS